MNLRPYQEEALQAVVDNLCAGIRQQLLVLATGLGKCLAKGTSVLMFDGSTKAIENIKVGDRVMGPDSLPRDVLALGHGFDQMYDVLPVKGEKYTVNSEHILSLVLTPRDKRNHKTNNEVIDISIKDYLSTSSTELKVIG